MLYSAEELLKNTILATDGEIGKVNDFLFDDEEMQIRYLVADTGDWLIDKKVLISPEALVKPLKEEKIFPVYLTKKQVENSPGIKKDRPVYLQYELDLHKFYGWKPYSAMAGITRTASPSAVGKSYPVEVNCENENPHLRSIKEVIGYKAQAENGYAGKIHDFIIDRDSWTIKFIIIRTGKCFFGKNVIVSPSWINSIKWFGQSVYLGLLSRSIHNSPEYDPSIIIDSDLEIILKAYSSK
ncbi:PRC-barrel domain-containing protein [candidate division KSB1 bacterium]